MATPRDRLDEPRRRRRVAERVAELVDDDVEARVDVDERIARPEDRTEILARNQLAGTAHEKAQDLPGLLLQSDSASLLG